MRFRHSERAGYRAAILRHRGLSDGQMAEVMKRTEDWRGNQTERGFSMALGRLGDPADGNCLIVLAYDSDEVLRGLLSFVPWGRGGVSFDVMRRDPQSANGLMEFMVTAPRPCAGISASGKFRSTLPCSARYSAMPSASAPARSFGCRTRYLCSRRAIGKCRVSINPMGNIFRTGRRGIVVMAPTGRWLNCSSRLVSPRASCPARPLPNASILLPARSTPTPMLPPSYSAIKSRRRRTSCWS